MNPDALAPAAPLEAAPSPSRTVPAALSLWAAAAFGASLFEPVTARTAPLVPVTIAALTLAQVLAYRRAPALRAWLARLDARWLVAWHVLRLPIGVRFLQLGSTGQIPAPLALRAGYGDVLAGALALAAIAALTAAPRARASRALALAWNALALLDILVVVASVAKIIFVDRAPEQLAGLMRAPGAALPLFVVPTVLSTHAYLFARLRGAHARG